MTPYYDADGLTIYNLDCREVLPTLGPIAHLITDPPYSDYVHSKSRRGGAEFPDSTDNMASYSRVKEFGFDAMTDELRKFVADEASRILQRWALVFSDVESSHLWRDAFTCRGLDYIRTGAWVKVGATPQFTGDRPATGFEAITIVHPTGRKAWNGGGHPALWRYPIVLNRSHDDPRLHTTQKPLPLMLALVNEFTDTGDLICDPFGGSMTTLAAAQMLGRRGIACELSEENCETGARRLERTEFADQQAMAL